MSASFPSRKVDVQFVPEDDLLPIWVEMLEVGHRAFFALLTSELARKEA
jgi:hypothetical protein